MKMYACVNCGKVLRSQQSLNYHLAQKPTTCEKYLRKLSNQEKQAAMETSSSPKPSGPVAPATQTTVASLSLSAKSSPAAVSLSSAAKSTVLDVTAPPLSSPVVSKIVGDDVSVSTSISPRASSAAKSNVTPLPSLAILASLASQKCPEPKKLLAGESVHKTMFDTDGYCWYADSGSSKKGRFYESCRCCAMYHSSDPSNIVAHIRTSKEMKCKCALNTPCKCKKGPQPPLFVVSRCSGKRIRLARHGVLSGERAPYEERFGHDSNFCKVNKVEMVSAVNKANMKAKARTAQSCQHLKTWQVCQAIEAGHQIPYKLVGERAVERLFSSARKARKSLLFHVDSASPVFKQLLAIPEFRCVNIEPCGEGGGMHAEFLFMPHASNELLCSPAGEVVAVDATFCCKKKWQLLVVWASVRDCPTKQLPVFVALMNSKYDSAYRSVFEAMRRAAPNWRPKAFTCDFETSMKQHFATIFDAAFQGCLWHFFKVLCACATWSYSRLLLGPICVCGHSVAWSCHLVLFACALGHVC